MVAPVVNEAFENEALSITREMENLAAEMTDLDRTFTTHAQGLQIGMGQLIDTLSLAHQAD